MHQIIDAMRKRTATEVDAHRFLSGCVRVHTRGCVVERGQTKNESRYFDVALVMGP